MSAGIQSPELATPVAPRMLVAATPTVVAGAGEDRLTPQPRIPAEVPPRPADGITGGLVRTGTTLLPAPCCPGDHTARRQTMQNEQAQGSRLIGVIIAVCVIGVVASMALPSFQGQVVKSRRADAKTTLLMVMQRQEAFFTENNTYSQDLRDLGYSSKTWNDSSDGLYQVRVMADSGDCALPACMRLAARPLANQSQAGDYEYRLWSTGRKQTRDGTWSNGWK